LVKLKTIFFSIKKSLISKYFLFLAIFFYFLSVSRYSVNVLDNKLYFIKHFIILFPAFFIFFHFYFLADLKVTKKYISIIVLLLIIILPFFIRGFFDLNEIIIFVQILLFFLACYYYSYYYKYITSNFSKFDFWLLVFIFFIPLLLNIFFEKGNFIYNTYYGRPRLLLGYFHPKEGAICLVTILLFYQIYFKKFFEIYFKIILNIIALILLYFMQSRNILIFYINFLLLNFLISRFNIKFILFTYFILPLFLLSISLFIYYKEINILLSNRLDWWLKNLNITAFGIGSNISDYSKTNVLSKLHVDNFYLEYLIENGYVFFLILLYLLYKITILIDKNKFNNNYINSIFISFLFFCFFDAGMFSSGNLLNFLVWIMIFSFFNKKDFLYNNEAI